MGVLIVGLLISIWLYTTPQEIACCDDPNLTQEQELEIINQYRTEERMSNIKKFFGVE